MTGDVGATGCRYCGIEPDQEFPRPSYHEMRVERDEARAALNQTRAALGES